MKPEQINSFSDLWKYLLSLVKPERKIYMKYSERFRFIHQAKNVHRIGKKQALNEFTK